MCSVDQLSQLTRDGVITVGAGRLHKLADAAAAAAAAAADVGGHGAVHAAAPPPPPPPPAAAAADHPVSVVARSHRGHATTYSIPASLLRTTLGALAEAISNLCTRDPGKAPEHIYDVGLYMVPPAFVEAFTAVEFEAEITEVDREARAEYPALNGGQDVRLSAAQKKRLNRVVWVVKAKAALFEGSAKAPSRTNVSFNKNVAAEFVPWDGRRARPTVATAFPIARTPQERARSRAVHSGALNVNSAGAVLAVVDVPEQREPVRTAQASVPLPGVPVTVDVVRHGLRCRALHPQLVLGCAQGTSGILVDMVPVLVSVLCELCTAPNLSALADSADLRPRVENAVKSHMRTTEVHGTWPVDSPGWVCLVQVVKSLGAMELAERLKVDVLSSHLLLRFLPVDQNAEFSKLGVGVTVWDRITTYSPLLHHVREQAIAARGMVAGVDPGFLLWLYLYSAPLHQLLNIRARLRLGWAPGDLGVARQISNGEVAGRRPDAAAGGAGPGAAGAGAGDAGPGAAAAGGAGPGAAGAGAGDAGPGAAGAGAAGHAGPGAAGAGAGDAGAGHELADIMESLRRCLLENKQWMQPKQSTGWRDDVIDELVRTLREGIGAIAVGHGMSGAPWMGKGWKGEYPPVVKLLTAMVAIWISENRATVVSPSSCRALSGAAIASYLHHPPPHPPLPVWPVVVSVAQCAWCHGVRVSKDDRTVTCPLCNKSINRDLAGAVNIWMLFCSQILGLPRPARMSRTPLGMDPVHLSFPPLTTTLLSYWSDLRTWPTPKAVAAAPRTMMDEDDTDSFPAFLDDAGMDCDGDSDDGLGRPYPPSGGRTAIAAPSGPGSVAVGAAAPPAPPPPRPDVAHRHCPSRCCTQALGHHHGCGGATATGHAPRRWRWAWWWWWWAWWRRWPWWARWRRRWRWWRSCCWAEAEGSMMGWCDEGACVCDRAGSSWKSATMNALSPHSAHPPLPPPPHQYSTAVPSVSLEVGTHAARNLRADAVHTRH